jgi:signal transduction histidine kinase
MVIIRVQAIIFKTGSIITNEMSAFTSLILTQLTVPPGDLIYYIILVFAVASALQSAFNHWRASEFPQARRAFMGLGILLAAQVIMFLFSGFGWQLQHIIDPKAILPPMERAFIVFAIIWITWLYAFPEPSRTADVTAVLLSVLVIAALGASLKIWQPQVAAISYNQTVDDWVWQIGSLFAALIGIITLFIRRPDGMWNGIILLSIGSLGHVGHLFFPVEGNYSGIVRLAYMAAYPILLTLPQRFSVMPVPRAANVSAPSSRPAPQKQESVMTERRRYSTDPKTFHAMLALAAESNPKKVSQAITRATAQTMLSDLCFMIYLTDNNNQLQIAGGYDLIREESLEGGLLNKSAIPMLANALQRGRPLRMPASSTSADVKGLGDILGLTNPGHLLCVPILTPEKQSLGGVLLLSPYSDRTWTAEDQAYLSNIAASLVPIIKRSQNTNQLEAANDQTRAKLADLELHVKELTQQLEIAQAESQKSSPPVVEMSSLMVAQEESQRIIAQLQTENVELRAGKDIQPSPSTMQMEKELKTALQETARLQNQLAEANMKAHELEKGHVTTKSTEQAEVIASISQELRQPLSSIVGYTDLLLGESVGILGALQRKFVERIKASTERINSLTDDMIQVTTLETELNDLKFESVDLNAVIDNAMSYTSAQVREKNISMHLDLPKILAPIQADREALQQILIHLLQNAGAATPFEGTVRLKVQMQTEEDTEFILVQVTDSGGGISANDLPRVFTRLYRADNVLIQGVGDTGVGLSITKTLTEAHHGRIWVESEQGVGSTFSVLLPITEKSAKTKGKK